MGRDGAWALGQLGAGLTYSVQLNAALLPAALPVPARGLDFVDDSYVGLKGHFDPTGQAWFQQPRGGEYLERAGELPGEEGGQVPGGGRDGSGREALDSHRHFLPAEEPSPQSTFLHRWASAPPHPTLFRQNPASTVSPTAHMGSIRRGGQTSLWQGRVALRSTLNTPSSFSNHSWSVYSFCVAEEEGEAARGQWHPGGVPPALSTMTRATITSCTPAVS